jgi:hypothetical protein
MADDAVAQLDGFLCEYTDSLTDLRGDDDGRRAPRGRGARGVLQLERHRGRLQPRREDPPRRVLGRRVPAMGESLLLRRARPPRPARPAEGQRHDRSECSDRESSDLDERVTALLDAAIGMWEWHFDAKQPTSTVVVSVSVERRPRR